MSNQLKLISLLAGLVGIVWGVFEWHEVRYTKLEAYAGLERRVEIGEIQQAYREALRDLIVIRDLSELYPEDVTIKKRLIQAQEDYDIIKAQLKSAKGRKK